MKSNYPEIDRERIEQMQEAYDAACREQMRLAYDEFIGLANEIMEAASEFVNTLIRLIRKFGENLGRMLFRQQLIEWRVPKRWADVISNRLYWKCTNYFGYRWLSIFCRRCLCTET
jgi:hypothetical protein